MSSLPDSALRYIKMRVRLFRYPEIKRTYRLEKK